MKVKGLSAVFIGVAICILSILVIHALTKTYQKNSQTHFSRELLAHAELVSSQVGNAIRNAKDNQIDSCTDENIDLLRMIANQYLYVYDLGVIAADEVICTANWGLFNPPSPLPVNGYEVAGGFQLYARADGIFPIPQRLDITRLNRILSFTVDFSFQQFLSRNTPFSYTLEMASRDHGFLDYQAEGQEQGVPAILNLGVFQVKTELCSRYFEYCVYTTNKRGGIFFFSLPVIYFLLILSIVFGALVGYAVHSYLYKKNSMEFRLRRAILRKFVYIEYQPILQAKTGQIIGVESLVRWRDTVYGNVSPELFIGIAENIGLYRDLTYHIALSSIEDMKPVLTCNKNFFVALNVTSFEVVDDSYLLFLKQHLESHGLQASQVKIEITEKISVPLATLSKFSQQAKESGFQVSLDDFGTGVANLVWLTEIAFDDIKIDRIFTQALNDAFKDKMVLSIMDMVSSLRKQVIFEGVETQGEFDVILQNFPTAYVQGWYFYKSLSKNSLFKTLQSHGVKMAPEAPTKPGIRSGYKKRN